jgi:putative transposase
MGQSLSQLYVHLIFGTKNRTQWLGNDIRETLNAYLVGILQNQDCPSVITRAVADHVHILLRQARTAALARIVEEAKRSSSKWIKSQPGQAAVFAWQRGYGAFSVSASMVPTVVAYIEGQEEHHRRQTFKEEYLAFLERHDVAYDERYLWD